MMLRRTGWTAVLLALVALVIPATIAWALSDPEIGKPAPAFTLNDVVTGKPVSLADFKGKIVVVRFQSIHCPWDKMRPEGGYERVLDPMAKTYADQGVVFLGINSNQGESVEDIKAYHEKHHINYAFLKDPGNQVADAYNASTTPHMYVVDRAGVLRYLGGIEKLPTSPEVCGQMDEQYLKPVLDALLSGSEPPYTKTKSKGCSIKRQK
jgi:peroxiredoxin